MPGEALDIIATGGRPYFNVHESEAATQVYCEDTDEFKVMQGGRELKEGHQRQPGTN
jgi:hypothetical protein